MYINQHSRLRLVAGSMAGCFLAFMLAACGGGGDDTSTADNSTAGGGGASTTNTSPVVTAPADNPSTGVEQSGNINYLVTTVDGSTSTVTGTVVYNAPQGTLTLNPGTPDALEITTEDDWENVTWPNQYSGAIHANGNAVLVCNGTTAEVGVSHNMQLVTSPLDIVKGKTFTFNECNSDQSSYDVVFNDDGSVTTDEGEVVSVAEVTAIFSDAGQTSSDGSNFKVRLYAYTRGSNTAYVLVETSSDRQQDDSFYKSVSLARQK